MSFLIARTFLSFSSQRPANVDLISSLELGDQTFLSAGRRPVGGSVLVLHVWKFVGQPRRDWRQVRYREKFLARLILSDRRYFQKKDKSQKATQLTQTRKWKWPEVVELMAFVANNLRSKNTRTGNRTYNTF